MNDLDHDILRQLADTWGLLLLCLIFIVSIGMAFRPGARERAERHAQIPLQDERDPQP